MRKSILVLTVLLLAIRAPARDKPEAWIEVHSPHFSVVSNSSEKQARRVADQFERMRSVFHTLFPKMQLEAGTSITVLAIKDERDFRALEPAEYLAKGQLKLAGLFLRGADKNYVLLRLDAEGEHPYATVYHEYTHFLLSKAEWMPLWLNEGLAEFYQNTDIREKEVALGQPSPENLQLLRQNRLMPLATLFTVDHSSPYYHEENKGSIFYGESWALTHYLEQKDLHDKTHRLGDYSQLVATNVDAVTAAQQTFGDLKQLQAALEGYVRQGSFNFLKLAGATDVDEASFRTETLTGSQADSIRADFLASNNRSLEARALLNGILQQEPNNVLAHETMGLLEFRERHLDEARKWFAQAVQLDSQSYLAHYYFAAISINRGLDSGDETKVENSLRASIKLNPNFAPSFERLAAFLTMQHRNLEEAHMMALNAVQLEPGNLDYRMTVANVLLAMQRGSDAATVIQNAIHLASSPEQSAMAEDFLHHVQEYAQQQREDAQLEEQVKDGAVALRSSSGVSEPTVSTVVIASGDAIPTGPHRFLVGLLRDVHCTSPGMDLNVISGGKTVGFHAGNYFKVKYSTLNVVMKGDLNPCQDLEGRSAKIEYVDTANAKPAALIAIEIRK